MLLEQVQRAAGFEQTLVWRHMGQHLAVAAARANGGQVHGLHQWKIRLRYVTYHTQLG